MATVKLPKGVTVYAGGREWRDEIPDALCPEHVKPVPAAPPTHPRTAKPKREKKR